MPSALTGTWTLAGGSNITLSQSGNAVSIIGSAPNQIDGIDANYGNMDTRAYAQIIDELFWNGNPNSAPMALAQNTSYMQPFLLPYPMSIAFIRLPGSLSHGASTTMGTTNNTTVSMSLVTTLNIHFYTDGTGANSLSLQQVVSTSAGWTYQISIQEGAGQSSASWSMRLTYPMSTNSAAASSLKETNATTNSIQLSTQSNTAFTGPKVIDIPFATSLPAGLYWLGIGSSTNKGTGAAAMDVLTTQSSPLSFYNFTQSNIAAVGELGAATNSSIQFPMGLGSYSNAGAGSTASVGFTNISVSSSLPQIAFAFHRTA